MHESFRAVVDALDPKFQALIGSTACRYPAFVADVPERGIYLFSEGVNHLYVGRTNTLRKRLRDHCSESSSELKAAFAFRIARRDTGRLKATYRKEGSRAQLLQDPEFLAAFTAAKRRVSKMDVRFVDEDDPVRQALLEIYVAVALKTPFNDFDNH